MQDTYLVLDDFGGRLGCSWRETDAYSADRKTLIRDLVNGEYIHPVRVVASNTSESWSRDMTMDVAGERRRRYPNSAKCRNRCSTSSILTGAKSRHDRPAIKATHFCTCLSLD